MIGIFGGKKCPKKIEFIEKKSKFQFSGKRTMQRRKRKKVNQAHEFDCGKFEYTNRTNSRRKKEEMLRVIEKSSTHLVSKPKPSQLLKNSYCLAFSILAIELNKSSTTSGLNRMTNFWKATENLQTPTSRNSGMNIQISNICRRILVRLR